jgi:hypothetical protein
METMSQYIQLLLPEVNDRTTGQAASVHVVVVDGLDFSESCISRLRHKILVTYTALPLPAPLVREMTVTADS